MGGMADEIGLMPLPVHELKSVLYFANFFLLKHPVP